MILLAENWEKRLGVTVVTGAGSGTVFHAVEQRLLFLTNSFVESFTPGDKNNGSIVVFLRPTLTGGLPSVLEAYICACLLLSCPKKGIVVLLPMRIALL